MFVPPESSHLDKLRFRLTSSFSSVMRFAGLQQKHLVVCGYPRSGTSLVYNMLAHGLRHEFKFTEFEKYFMYYLHKLGNIATKAPLDVMHLNFIDELNINKKQLIIIILVRDFREIVTSRHPIYPDEYFIGYDYSYWPVSKDFSKWEYCAPGIIPISRKIRDVMGREDVLVVKYEDLVRNPDVAQKKIAEKFGLHFTGLFSEYEKSSSRHPYRYEGKYSPQDKALVLEGGGVKIKEARWIKKEHRARVIDQFEKCPDLFELLVNHGYEKDDSWFDLLENDSTKR